MKTVTINLVKEDILSAVYNVTGYTGRATSGGMDRLSATSDEIKLEEDILGRSLSKMVPIFNGYEPAVTPTSIAISVPSNFDDKSIPDIEKEVSSYIVNNVCAEWFYVARNTEDTVEYQRRSAENLENINNLLARRVKPTK